MNMPKVSIIVPVYGVEKYIERCARSLFEQTLDDIEYLFIDDCTPDKSIKILKTVLEDYPNRKTQAVFHRMEQNSGQATVRKWGMLNASGDFIIHCDPDDWIDTTMYEKMYNKAINENADIVICNCYDTNGDMILKERHGGKYIDSCKCIHEMLHGKMWWSLCNKLIKRNLQTVDILYPEDNMGEDMCLTLQMMVNSQKIAYTPDVHYHYFVNPNSIVHTTTESMCIAKFEQLCRNVELVRKFYRTHNLENKYNKGLSYISFKAKNTLLPLLYNVHYYKRWRETYKNVELAVCLDNDVATKERIMALLSLFGLFPIPRGKYSYMLNKH